MTVKSLPGDDLTVVSVSDLWFRYPSAGLPALQGVSLAVRKGECLGLIGPSGAGKSTLCQALKGIIPHSLPGELEGEVRVLGRNVVDADELASLSQRVGLVLQDPEAQIIGMTVAEDLAYGPENYEVAPEEIRERSLMCLDAVGLDRGLLDRDTYALSGGEKQRLAVASALMLGPEVLILDEPTSELDPLGKDQVFEVLDNLRRAGRVTLVIVEHEVERLAKVADRIAVLDGGRLVADGTPLNLFTGTDVEVQTAGERLPAAAALLQALRADGESFPPLQPTLDLAALLDDVATVLVHR